MKKEITANTNLDDVRFAIAVITYYVNPFNGEKYASTTEWDGFKTRHDALEYGRNLMRQGGGCSVVYQRLKLTGYAIK